MNCNYTGGKDRWGGFGRVGWGGGGGGVLGIRLKFNHYNAIEEGLKIFELGRGSGGRKVCV